jgi:hypothetical protein
MRPSKQRGPVRFTLDADKKAIALVPIYGSKEPAKLLVEDYAALMEAGYGDRWVLHSSGNGFAYVRCASARHLLGNTETIARLILNLPKGHRVCYQDHNRLNLRRDNLVLVERKRQSKPDAVL